MNRVGAAMEVGLKKLQGFLEVYNISIVVRATSIRATLFSLLKSFRGGSIWATRDQIAQCSHYV